MRPLLRVILIIATFFATTFVIMKLTGILTADQIEYFLLQAKSSSPIYVAIIIALLLFSDLFIAIPTLTVIILSGYFLGQTYGAIAALLGMLFAGIFGYTISRFYGDSIFAFLIKDPHKRNEAIVTFTKHGVMMILLSRALPILPEVTACLSGMTRMKFTLFITAWLASAFPYVMIATYAGSISSVENPKPALFTAIAISTSLWISWIIYHRLRIKPNM